VGPRVTGRVVEPEVGGSEIVGGTVVGLLEDDSVTFVGLLVGIWVGAAMLAAVGAVVLNNENPSWSAFTFPVTLP